jgi:hypothetical protein
MPEIKIGTLLMPKLTPDYNWKIGCMMYGFLLTVGYEDDLAVSGFPKPPIKNVFYELDRPTYFRLLTSDYSTS